MDNFGRIEREGSGTVKVGFNITELGSPSKLNINSGTLWVNPGGSTAVRQLGGTTTLNAGATLKVTEGSLVGNYVLDSGLFQTFGGGSVTVDGKFEMHTGSVLKIAADQLAATATGGTLMFTDQVKILGGDVIMKTYNTPQGSTSDWIYSGKGVDIANAASLHITPYGTPPPGTSYCLITAWAWPFGGGNGITGNFGPYDIGNLTWDFTSGPSFENLVLSVPMTPPPGP